MYKKEKIMMSKQEKINELLKSNRTALLNNENKNAICYDGIVNEAMYEHVVVLLKETNGKDSTGKTPEKLKDWDYHRWLKEQQVENLPEKKINKYGEIHEEQNVFYHSTFRKLCYWLSLLFDSLENDEANDEKFKKNGQVDIEITRKVLNRVAVINLKKSWGDSQTDIAKLETYLENTKIVDILKKQMAELSPKIVLCCSPDVYRLAKKVYGNTDHNTYEVPSTQLVGKNIEFTVINGATYVSFYHPQYSGKTDQVFSDFAIEVFKHLKSFCQERLK